MFASDKILATVIPTSDVKSFNDKYKGTEYVGAPLGGPDRLDKFPKVCYVSKMHILATWTRIRD